MNELAKPGRVVCTLKFYYDPETYLYEWDEKNPTDEEIFKRCREMMVDDLNEGGFIEDDFIIAEYVIP